MSSETVREILWRANVDDAFLQQMIEEPEVALAEYGERLTPEAKTAFIEHASQIWQYAEVSDDERAFRIIFGPFRIKWLKGMPAAPGEIATPDRLEAAVVDTVSALAASLEELSVSLDSLRDMEPSEREPHLVELLRRWETHSGA